MCLLDLLNLKSAFVLLFDAHICAVQAPHIVAVGAQRSLAHKIAAQSVADNQELACLALPQPAEALKLLIEQDRVLDLNYPQRFHQAQCCSCNLAPQKDFERADQSSWALARKSFAGRHSQV